MKIICVVILASAILLNVLFVSLRTDDTHILMLILNVLVDTAGGWAIIYIIYTQILPVQQFCSFASKNPERVSGTVSYVSAHTVCHRQLDCLEITVDEKNYFLPVCFLNIETNRYAELSVVSGIIVEVSYE